MAESTPPLPINCRAPAYEFFMEHMPFIDDTPGLLGCALAVSMHETDADPAIVDRQLQAIADRIHNRARQGSPRALVAHAHQVLFGDMGFSGSNIEFSDTDNSYIASVIAKRRGLPITLCLVYKVVLERVGIPVTGIHAPGHFMVALEMDDRRTIVDPFFGGLPLTEDEALERVRVVTGNQSPDPVRALPEATHVDWISRLLANLEHIFYHRQNRRALAAMLELHHLLGEAVE